MNDWQGYFVYFLIAGVLAMSLYGWYRAREQRKAALRQLGERLGLAFMESDRFTLDRYAFIEVL